MKYPALTRLFAVVLALLCLTMLLAGLGSAGSALRERKDGLADHARLTARIEEYREILARLDGAEPYSQMQLALQKEQKQHDKDASRHRTELAIYTATKSGLQTGEAAMDQAYGAFAAGKAQYEEGRALFEEQEKLFWDGYRQFQEGKRQLEEGRKALETASAALASLRAQLEQTKGLTAILESDDPDARLQLTVAAYDNLLLALDQATALYGMLKDQGGISPEQVQLLVTMVAQQSGVDVTELLEGVTWEGITEEDLQRVEDLVAAATGMRVEEIREKIREQREAIAGMDADTPLTEEQFAALQEAYAQSRGWVLAVTAAMEEKLNEYEAQIQEAQAQLDAAQKQIDEMEPYMEQGKAAMEQARAALDLAEDQIRMGEQGLAQGRAELTKKEAELAEKEAELRREKTKLDAEAKALAVKTANADAQEELERRETSVRLILMGWEGVQSRVDSGMELLPAAEEYSSVLLRETERMATCRLLVSALMVLGSIGGFLGIPAAFEKTKSRFRLLAPVLFCFACAIGAEALCRYLGRGDSYSALAVSIFAFIQLLLVIPKKKKS